MKRPAKKNRAVGKRMGAATTVVAWVGVMLAVCIIASSIYWEFTRTQDGIDSIDSEHSLPEGEPPEIVTPVKIDLTSVTGAEPVVQIAAQPSGGDRIDTGALLKLAGQQFRLDRLSTPPDDNAMDTYNVILKMQPDNSDAKRGLQRIAARYAELSRRKLGENQLDEAEAFARSGLAAWPRDSGLIELQKEIAQRSEARSDRKEVYSESIQSYITAANAGNAPVQFQLALAFANGDGVARDADQALKWFGKAARQGHVKAQYNLALGQLFGPSPDQANAGRWMESAGNQAYKPAYRVLGWMYTTGTGVSKGAKDAVIWSARGTKWSRPPTRGEVAIEWQRSFEDVYRDSIIKVREEKMVESQDLR